MTNAEFWASRWEMEQAAFRKVLAALPADKLDYTPHAKSAAAGNLAWQLAVEQNSLAELMTAGETNYPTAPRPGSLEEILAAWDRGTEQVRAALKSADESKWDGSAKFLMGGQEVWTDKLRNMLWGFLFDMVHHRGQLSTYLRPMGGKVPAIYGPSGDSES